MFKGIIIAYIVISLLALQINKTNTDKGLKGIPLRDCLNPIKWVSVFYGFFIKLMIPKHVFEQYVIRIYDEDCSVCVTEGECIGGKECGKDCACGCDTLAKMYSPTEQCTASNWGPIIYNKKQYEDFREAYPIKITVEHGK